MPERHVCDVCVRAIKHITEDSRLKRNAKCSLSHFFFTFFRFLCRGRRERIVEERKLPLKDISFYYSSLVVQFSRKDAYEAKILLLSFT